MNHSADDYGGYNMQNTKTLEGFFLSIGYAL